MLDTTGQPTMVWVKIAGQEKVWKVGVKALADVDDLVGALYDSTKFAFARGTIDHLSVDNKVRMTHGSSLLIAQEVPHRRSGSQPRLHSALEGSSWYVFITSHLT